MMVIMNSFSVYASANEEEASYDLRKGGTQKFFVENEDGEIEEITIEEVENNTRMDAGTYKVTHKVSGWTAGFYVIIVDDQIQAAHSPFYSTTVGEITNCSLIRNSTSKVTYAFTYKTKYADYNTGVIAKISNNELQVNKIG